ncbi:hypothetical protein IW150_007006, partial [Coemansia sp. RSA 2607]
MDMYRNLIQRKIAVDSRNPSLNYFLPLTKSESLYRDIEALDRVNPNETIKVAILYVGPGQ